MWIYKYNTKNIYVNCDNFRATLGPCNIQLGHAEFGPCKLGPITDKVDLNQTGRAFSPYMSVTTMCNYKTGLWEFPIKRTYC